MKRQALALLLSWACIATSLPAQIAVDKPHAPVIVRPYLPPAVSAARLENSSRLHSLVRAGKLYLSVQDAIAIAIENNLDLEVDRYSPLIAQWNLQRAQAGGPLRGVTGGNTLVNQVTSGQGVAGSQVSAGLINQGGGGGSGGGGAIVSQIGPVTANLDPVLQNTSLYSHTTQPQANRLQSQVSALIDTHHIFNTFVQQGLLSGGFVQVSANESYLKENTPTDILNPSVAPVAQIFARHNFLQGFGVNVNGRFIRVAQRNLAGSRETFRSQLLNLVAAVLNLYWDLVSGNDALQARQKSLDVSRKFFDDTRMRIQLGVIARVELFRAQAELSSRKQEIAISEATVRQQENLLKNALSRDGLADPVIDSASVVPLDRIQVPENDDLPPLRELVERALRNRPDVALGNITLETAEISALGTANGLLPTLQGIGSLTASGLAGEVNPASRFQPDPYYVGGLGNALGQVFRHNYGNRRAAVLFQGSLGNRIAQGDYGIDQLQLRQGQLVNRRNRNQLVVDISNQMVALRQARARYSTAVNTRVLQEQLLDKEQQRFSLGGSSIDNIIVVQRSLALAQSAEVGALSSYSRARVSLDQVLGQTLDRNHVSVDDALAK